MQRSRHDQEHEDLGKARGHVRVGVSCATVAAYAGTGNCNVRWDASTTCHDTYAPQGGEYVLTVECWGVHGRPKQVPLYEVGPCEQSSRWSPRTGHAASNRRTSWRTSLLNVGVVTGTHVEIYRA